MIPLRVTPYFAVLVAALAACSATHPKADANSNWLRECAGAGDCASDQLCACGVCTIACIGDGSCQTEATPDAKCVSVTAAQCVGASKGAVCTANCDRDSQCGGGALSCVENSCVRVRTTSRQAERDASMDASVMVDASTDAEVMVDSASVNESICGAESDGGVTGGPTPACEPAAFAYIESCPGGCGGLFVTGVSGDTAVLIDSDAVGNFGLGWSPDGKHLAFVSNRDGDQEIYVTDPDGQNQRNLTNNPFQDYFVGWLSRGTEIAFWTERDGGNWPNIWIMNADGSNQRPLVTLPVTGASSFSPDGTRVAVSTDASELWLMNADGTDARIVAAADNGNSKGPEWSRDGTKIAFVSPGALYDIHVIDADGTNEVRVTKSPRKDQYPTWSRDGTRLAFSKDYSALYTIGIDGSDEQLLKEGVSQAAWRW